jgi:hypothetical protein
MRRLFLVFAKLLGLLQLWWALLGFAQVVAICVALPSPSGPPRSWHILATSVGILIYIAFAFGFAWVLLARTEWVADKLGIKDETAVLELEKHSALPVGVQLLGVFFSVHAVSNLVRELLYCYDNWSWGVSWSFWSRAIAEAVQLGLGVVLMLASERVVAIIAKKRQPESPEDG